MVANYVITRESRLDILVSNAGIRRDPKIPCDVLTVSLEELQASMLSHSYSDWEDTFRINTTAHYFLSVALFKLLANAATSKFDSDRLGQGRLGREVGCGVVIIMSSCASGHNSTNVDLSSYATSKAATDHLVRLLASKFARWGVRVNSINPGCELSFLFVLEDKGEDTDVDVQLCRVV